MCPPETRPAKPPASPISEPVAPELARTAKPPVPPVTSECSMVETTARTTPSTSVSRRLVPSNDRPSPTEAAEPTSMWPMYPPA